MKFTELLKEIITDSYNSLKEENYNLDNIRQPTVAGMIYNHIAPLFNTIPGKGLEILQNANKNQINNLAPGLKQDSNWLINNIEKLINPFFIKKEHHQKWINVEKDIKDDINIMTRFIKQFSNREDSNLNDIKRVYELIKNDKFLDHNDPNYKNSLEFYKDYINAFNQ